MYSKRSISLLLPGRFAFGKAVTYKTSHFPLHISHPSVSECLGYFHVLAIVNSSAMNTGVHVYPGVGLLDHTVTLFLAF